MAFPAGGDDRFNLAQRAGFGVERGAHQVVADAVYKARDIEGLRFAEIERFSVGCEGGRGLQIVGRRKAGIHDQGMVVHIHHHQIGGQVEDLDGPLVARPEALADGVDGAGEPAAVGMPVAVGHVAERAVGLGGDPFADAVFLDEGGAVCAPEMEEELRRVGGVGRMAVHALAGRERAFDDGLFPERMDVALVDADGAVGGVTRRNLAVGDAVFVERHVADVEDEIAPLGPGSVFTAQYGEMERSAGVAGGEAVPFLHGEIGPAAARLEFSAVAARDADEDAVVPVGQVEVQGRDPGGDGHADIVGIDGRQFFHERGLAGTGGQQERGQEGNPPFHCPASVVLSRCQAV